MSSRSVPCRGKQSGGVPELKRVIVSFDKSIAMEPTLEKSLLQIFGGAGNESSPVDASLPAARNNASLSSTDIPGLAAEAERQFTFGQDELKRGNWAGYGDAMKKVEKLIEQLKEKAK